MLFGLSFHLFLMSNNEVTSSEMSNRQKELDDEIEKFHKTANAWLQAINKDHRKETRQLIAENKKLKQQIADLQKKIESTPKEEQQAQHEDFKRMLAEAEEESRKAKEECKKMTEERDIFKLAYRQHAKMTEKIQEKLYFFIPKTDLHEEMDEMWHQAVEETKE